MAYDPWAYTSPYGVLNGGALISEVGLLATLRLRERGLIIGARGGIVMGRIFLLLFTGWRASNLAGGGGGDYKRQLTV